MTLRVQVLSFNEKNDFFSVTVCLKLAGNYFLGYGSVQFVVF